MSVGIGRCMLSLNRGVQLPPSSILRVFGTGARCYHGGAPFGAQRSALKASQGLALLKPLAAETGAARARLGVRTIVLRSNWDESKSRTRKKTTVASKVFFGLLLLMPIVAFGLGTWQVRRLQWKLDLIAKAENRLILPPLDLPAYVDPAAVEDFDYRRVRVTGEFDHTQEKLVGPRLHHNKRGYYVVTPLRRRDGSTLLVFRGWVDDAHKLQRTRPESLQRGEVSLDCLLHPRPQKNSFTPEREADGVEFHFMDIDAMAKDTGAQPIFIEALEDSELMPEQKAMRGVPIGGRAEVTYRNSHFQYILTWYGIALFTAVMLAAVVRQRLRPTADPLRRKVAHARKWQ